MSHCDHKTWNSLLRILFRGRWNQRQRSNIIRKVVRENDRYEMETGASINASIAKSTPNCMTTGEPIHRNDNHIQNDGHFDLH